MNDEWIEDLLELEKTYGQALANRISDIIDEGKIPLANCLICLLLKQTKEHYLVIADNVGDTSPHVVMMTEDEAINIEDLHHVKLVLKLSTISDYPLTSVQSIKDNYSKE